MPRSGPGIFTLPATYLAVDGELATAAQHNDPLEDLQTDANTVRPIVAGGTGASTASGALTALGAAGTATPGVFTGSLSGVVLTNAAVDVTNDIGISVGASRDTTDVYTLYLSSAIVKRGDAAWAVGTGNGAMDTGSIANGNRYFVWLIRRPDTGVVDALFSLSSTAPTMPANYTQKALIGSVGRLGSANTLPRSYSVPYTDWASYTPTFTGWGTATAITFKWQRLAGTCNIYGRWVSGVATAVEARATLPPLLFHSGNSLDFGGMALRDAAFAGHWSVLLEDGVQYMTFGRQDAGTSGFAKALGNAISSTGLTWALQASFQPFGW